MTRDTGLGRTRPAPAPGGAARVEVSHLDGDSYRISTRTHDLLADQPDTSGGSDLGPTPVELLVAALAACTAHYAGSYLHRHGRSREGLRVTTDFTMAEDRPARVGSVRMVVTVPEELTAREREALTAVMDHCTVHNSLRQPPQVETVIA